ncbi:glycosyltransferase [Vibrio alginolyticus]|uniref:glycosyltransferase n=1 Tax=Vibrio alginolyticus TaxID=663 RepID=UPI00215ECB0D|nr:glycosyltransferase [Vibrio alginolyticus]MCS0164743.1 glycosyltransferase [Vibrio alginolyticus]
MNKIAFVISSSEVGGAQTWVRDQIEILFESGVETFVITNKAGWLTETTSAKVYYIPELDKKISILGIWKLARIIKKETITTLVASSANAGVFSRIAALKSSTRCIYVSHGWSCIYNGGYLKKIFCSIECILSKITYKILCVSSSDYENARDIIGIKENKLQLIVNGIDNKSLNIKDGKRKNSTSLKLLSVGRINHPKRFDLLVESIKNMDNVELYIVGSGPLISDIPNQSNVHLLGEIPSFSSYSDFDVFCLISDSEGLPMSALEAACSGLPLVLSDVGGCSDVINKTFKNGLLVENTTDDIVSAINDIQLNYAEYLDNALKVINVHALNNKAENYFELYFS